MCLNKLSLFLSILFFSFQVNAEKFDNEGYTLHFHQCMDNSGGITSSMLDCISEEMRIQDLLLNTHYKMAMKSFAKEQQNQLREAQRAWLKMRKNDSIVIEYAIGGTLGTVCSYSLFLEYTVKRVQFLKKLHEN